MQLPEDSRLLRQAGMTGLHPLLGERSRPATALAGRGRTAAPCFPVGEALIMIAAGPAVAIPAVLAYNAFTRGNRVVLAELDGFAHDLLAFLTTGGGARRNESPCPDGVPAGEGVFEKMLEMTLPLAVAIGVWFALVLPWGAPA